MEVRDRIASLVDRLRNSDIRWDGTLDGCMPTVAGDAARQLLTAGAAAIPQLIDAVQDESKFVAAHVLLTLVSGVAYQTTPWNGLAVDIGPDGDARFDVEQRASLARRWRAWYTATPYPPSLAP